MQECVRIDYAHLTEFCAKYLESLGVPRTDAVTVATVLASTDARGLHSHGTVLLGAYTVQLKAGGINATPRPALVQDHAATALLDGDAGMGQVVSKRGMELAIAKAKEFGIGVVSARNSHHFGAAGYYAMMALEHDMIGFASSTAGVTMTAPGAAERLIGNNPLAFAFPAKQAAPIVFDIAMSAVAGGKVLRMAEEGEPVPLGWLVDDHGNGTTDPNWFKKGGALLPFGGHKGFGLAIAVEVLSGILSGASMTGDIGLWRESPGRPADVGHLFMAFSIGAFRATDAFENHVDMLIRRLSNIHGRDSGEPVYIPGTRTERKRNTSGIHGVALPHAVHASLRALAQDVGIDMPDAHAC